MYYAGIDLGGTNIATGIVNEKNEIVAKVSVKTLKERPAEEVIKDMYNSVAMACEKAGISVDDIESIGIGAPGTIDPKNGIVLYSNNFGWENVMLFDILKKYTNKPLYVSNDANCGALGEFIAGGAKGCENAVVITVGTGVGGGIIINGKILEGFNGAGGEFGHSILIKDGEPCTCGRKGCLEAYASVTALINQTKAKMKQFPNSLMNKLAQEDGKVNGKTAFAAAKKGDTAAQEVVDTFLSYLAEGIVNAINIFQPDVVLIGGGISNEGDYILNPLREFADKYSYASKQLKNKTQIRRATLSNDAGIVGAAMLWKN